MKLNNPIRIIALILLFLIVSLPISFAYEYNLVYDGNGNLVTGDNFYREYNELNQLVRIRQGNTSTGTILEEFKWHPIENRVLVKYEIYSNGTKKSTTIYVNKNYVYIKNESGSFKEKYIYQDNILVTQVNTDGQKQFIHNDHLGSVSLVTDVSGNVIENSFYSPDGEIISGGKTSRYDFIGKEFDSLSEDYDLNSRRYNPKIRKFIQPDDLIQDIYDSQALNRYAYARNNPYLYIDEDGNAFWIPWVIGGAAGLIHAGYHLYKNPGDYSGAIAHGTTTFISTSASIYLPVTRVAGGALQLAKAGGGALFTIGAGSSLAHSYLDKEDFTTVDPYGTAFFQGVWNAFGGKLLNFVGVPGITNYKPGQFYPSSTFSPAMFREFFSQSIITGTPPAITTLPTLDYNRVRTLYDYYRYQYYFSEKSDKSSSGSRSGGSGGGGGCRCGPWGDLREEAQNAKAGETAKDIIDRWRRRWS